MALFPTCTAFGGVGPVGPVPPCSIQSIFQLFFNIYNYLLGAAAAVCILMIIIGGMAYLAPYLFGGSEEGAKWGKTTLMNALIGLAIILLSYLIIATLLSAFGVTNEFHTELKNYNIGF